jgi:glycosyltransferase involved in cell wall biosynthesis
MQEILIISNYYPPEKGAAANRIEQLAQKLHQNNYKVSVLCPLANYPKGELFPEYKGKIWANENRQNIAVKRLWIYPSVSKNIFKRTLSVLSFLSGLLFYLLFHKTPHKVIVQSPPLLLSFISVLVLSLQGKKIILNVSDLWPIAAIELKALKADSISNKVLLLLEKFIYSKATIIFGQSNEIIDHIHGIFPSKECYLYRNFPEHSNSNFNYKIYPHEPIKLFYAGLLGVAQGVFDLCEKMKTEHLSIEFHVFGDGAEKSQIEAYINQNPLKKIVFHGMVERSVLHQKIEQFDIAIVPLTTRIFGSVPSKIFEYSALGFPILYCGGGEGESIVRENNLGWVAEVGNFESLNATLVQISETGKIKINDMKKQIFNHAQIHFNLDCQMKGLIEKELF